MRLPALNVRRLAAAYSREVRRALTASQLLNVQRGDATEHDYCDANDLLAVALAEQLPGASILDHADALNNAAERAAAAGFELRRVLVACEFSGIVRDAFAARGHDVMSADLLETEQPGPHFVGDVREVLGDGWDTMIAHPPCTYLCNSGLKHLRRAGVDINPERWQLMREGAQFFNDLGAAPIAEIARENPIPHGPARELIGRPTQYTQMYEFGDDHSKKTGWWLTNLPKLISDPAQHVPPRMVEYGGKLVKRWANQSPCGADNTPGGPNQWRIRSRFLPGIASAMADQWGRVAA